MAKRRRLPQRKLSLTDRTYHLARMARGAGHTYDEVVRAGAELIVRREYRRQVREHGKPAADLWLNDLRQLRPQPNRWTRDTHAPPTGRSQEI